MKTVRSVLLVDDSDDDEFIFRRLLRKCGIRCAVLRLRDGQAAIDYFERKDQFADIPRSEEADVLFLDINMPRASGFDVLKWLRTHRPEPAPFVVAMLSSSNHFKDQEMANSLGVSDYWVKPPTQAQFDQLARRHNFSWQTEVSAD